MRTLILGASGFVGGAIARHFLEAGHEVAGMVREPTGRVAIPDMVLHAGEVGDPNAIARACEDKDVLVVAVGLPEGRPEDDYRWLHIAGTENIIAAARDRGVPRVVFLSCADVVLSDEDRVHWSEKREVARPVGARAQALKLGEELALSQSDASLAVTALRPGWVWGAGDPRFVGLAAEARDGGIDLCGDGKNLVATTYIEHLAQAALNACTSPHAPGRAYYVGDPEFLELGEFLTLWCKAAHLPLPRTSNGLVRRTAARLGLGGLRYEETLRRSRGTHFDMEKAAQELMFTPAIPIDEGMRRFSRWVDSQHTAQPSPRPAER